jgi:hypothetical protein
MKEVEPDAKWKSRFGLRAKQLFLISFFQLWIHRSAAFFTRLLWHVARLGFICPLSPVFVLWLFLSLVVQHNPMTFLVFRHVFLLRGGTEP